MISRTKPFFLFILSILVLTGCRIDGTITCIDEGVEGVEVILTGPESNTVTDNNGEFSFKYLPPGKYTVTPVRGKYSFSPESRAVEIKGLTDKKEVYFEASANQQPAAEPQTVHTQEGAPVEIFLQGSDPDGDSLTFRVASEPEHGSLSGTPPELIYTPAYNYSGTDEFYFIASDGHFDSEPADVAIQIAPINDPPSAEDDVFTAETPPVVTGDVLANDSDPEDDPLTISDFTQPAAGSVIYNEDNTFTYTPGSSFTGQDSFTYTAADSSDATDTAEVTILVLPAVTITAEPQSIEYSDSTTLSWTAGYADTVTIEPDIGRVSASGSTTVSPKTSTIYTITASGPGGTATDSVSVDVNQPPQMTLGISPSVINHGDSATLTWSASPADRVYISHDIGEVSATGSMTVTPDYTTTYELTAVNGELTTHHAVSVKVLGNPPDPQPEGTFGNQYNDLVPEDASLESFDTNRFVVITGMVEDKSGNPIHEVNVEIINHPEYGSTTTDESGRFSIPAEGGGLLVVSYEKENYLTAHRKVNAPVLDVIPVEPVTLLTRDPAATTVSFNGDPNTVITHQSTETTDEFGARSATMVFSGDTRAYELDKYGNRVRELSSITARATEYETPQSMPAGLPPNSAYTYCTELEADSIESIEFDQPVTVYVDNFLGFEVGEIVPVGYYDRDAANWVPSENGRIVRLLDTDLDDTLDALDANGDDQADDLNGNGNTSDEITGLVQSDYQPGDTCWRFKVKHFTPVDCNWPYGPPEEAIVPNPEGPPVGDLQRNENEDCNSRTGSHVSDRSRILHEDIAIAGTDLTLHYASNRVSGYKTVITVPASGGEIPASLKRIVVRVKVAGRIIEKTLNPLPNQTAEFVWDGRDHPGRLVKHTSTANVGVGFVYQAIYRRPVTGFGEPGIGWTGSNSRKEITLWKRKTIKVFPPHAITKGTRIQGWTLSAHHHLDPLSPSVVQEGDGSPAKNADLNIINTLSVFENRINCVESDRAGNIYAGTDTRVYKLTPNGNTIVVAGSGEHGFTGDGGPAVEAKFGKIMGIAFSETGELYIADTRNHSIKKMDRNGVISTVAGTGEQGFSGDGGPAQAAMLNKPADIEFDQSGNIYIADTGNARIRKVNPRNVISTYAGGGESRTVRVTATDFNIRSLGDLGVDGEGNIYFAERHDGHCRWVGWERVLKIDISGIVSKFAGSFCSGPRGNGYPATEVPLGTITGLEADSGGNVYVSHFYQYDINYNWGDYDSLVRKINTHGLERIIAGTWTNNAQNNSGIGYGGDGGPSTRALLSKSLDITLDGSGRLYIADSNNQAIRTVGPPATFSQVMEDGEVAFASEEGSGYIMDSTGKHQKTIDLETGKILYTFTYESFDNQELLTSITDRFGNQTRINRYADGTPYSVVSPDGLTTLFSVDADNHLTRVTLADGGIYDSSYTSGGLMTYKAEPEAAHTYHYDYDENGRITDTYDNRGGHRRFDRYVDETGKVHNSVLSAEGNITNYEDFTFSTGKYTSIIIGPAGAETTYTRSSDGLAVEKDLSCGMNLDFKYDLDPEYKYRYVREMTELTPSGLTGLPKRMFHTRTLTQTTFRILSQKPLL